MIQIDFRRPALEDQSRIREAFRQYPSRSCERTFANVYLWAGHYQVEYGEVSDTVVFCSRHNGLAFDYPVGELENVRKAIDTLRQYAKEQGEAIRFLNITPEQFAQLCAWYPGEFQIRYNRDLADYVYERESLATLAGKKLHGKRNHINKFKTLYQDWCYEEISKENVEECFQMALRWRTENGCEADPEKNAEMCVTMNSLRLFKELQLQGGALRVNGKIVAFTLGEPLCEDTFVVHIEKAFAQVEGAYPMINQQFVQHICQQYTYINREEDVGAEGLRRAKLSYRPAFLVEKGVVTPVHV